MVQGPRSQGERFRLGTVGRRVHPRTRCLTGEKTGLETLNGLYVQRYLDRPDTRDEVECLGP